MSRYAVTAQGCCCCCCVTTAWAPALRTLFARNTTRNERCMCIFLLSANVAPAYQRLAYRPAGRATVSLNTTGSVRSEHISKLQRSCAPPRAISRRVSTCLSRKLHCFVTTATVTECRHSTDGSSVELSRPFPILPLCLLITLALAWKATTRYGSVHFACSAVLASYE